MEEEKKTIKDKEEEIKKKEKEGLEHRFSPKIRQGSGKPAKKQQLIPRAIAQ